MPDLAKLNVHTSSIVDLLDLDPDIFVFDGGYPTTPGGKGWGWQGTPGGSRFLPYVIVVPLAGGMFDGPLGCPDDDASLLWQITCVGATRAQCEAIVDRVNIALVGHQLTVPNRFIARVSADMAGGGARRDDTVQPPVFIATPRYRVDSTPMPGGS